MKFKILFLLQFPPPVHGSSLIGERIKNSAKINETFDCEFIDIATSRNMTEIGKILFPKISRFISLYKNLLNTILFNKYDLCLFAVTASGPAFYRDLFSIFILKLFKVKYVLLMNNKGVKNNHSTFVNNLFYAFLFKNSYVVQNSEYLYNDIEKYVLKKYVFFLPNGIPDVIEKPLIKMNENDIVQLLYLANMTVSKGVFELIDACEILKRRGVLFNCIFVGAWNDIDLITFKKYVSTKGLDSFVSYNGKKYDQEKYNSFQSSDIFVFPTYYSYECFPLVLLEAMQFYLPVVSTYEGGIPDIVEDGVTGFLVPQRDVKVLADKLEILIKDDVLREKMGKAGRIKYENEFTLDKFENRLIEILNSVLKINYAGK